MRRAIRCPVSLAALTATAAACSFSAGTGVSVDKDELAKAIAAQYFEQVGRAPESVECPDDLEGDVGATMRCTLDADGLTYGVEVNVTEVKGTDVIFDLALDDQPQ